MNKYWLNLYQSIIVSVTYYHKICGEHKTQILLSIQNGNQITLNLFGETISTNYFPRLSIQFNTIYLKSQQIGLVNEQILTQFIPINNSSNNDFIYSVDIINKQNKWRKWTMKQKMYQSAAVSHWY